MVNVTNRTNVYVRLFTLELFFCHSIFFCWLVRYLLYEQILCLMEPMTRIELVTSSLPRMCSTD